MLDPISMWGGTAQAELEGSYCKRPVSEEKNTYTTLSVNSFVRDVIFF